MVVVLVKQWYNGVEVMKLKEEVVRITLRLPKDIWEKLKKEAEKNDRSLNKEIINKIK